MIKRYWTNQAEFFDHKYIRLENPVEICIYNDIKDNLIEWHKIEGDIKPKECESVLVLSNYIDKEDLGYDIAHYECDVKKGKVENVYWFIDFTSTVIYPKYWAYLPKPPKGE